jgi:hypothetical protein
LLKIANLFYREKFPDEKIPLLSDALDLCLDLDMRVMIDIKDPSPKVAEAVLEQFRRRPELLKRAMVSSFFPSIIYQVRSSNPSIVCSMAIRPGFCTYRGSSQDQGPNNPRFKTFWKNFVAQAFDHVIDWGQWTFLPSVLGLSAILISNFSTDRYVN